MRTVDNEALSTLDGRTAPMIMLVEMMLTEPLRMCSATRGVTFGGEEYLALGHLGAVETIDDSPGENKSLRFSLNGVNRDQLAIALQEPIRNKTTTIRLAVLHPDNHAVLDAPTVWTGSLDQMPIQMGKDTSTINVTAEHRGATYARPKPLRYTDVDQQRLHPGDTSGRFAKAQANHPDVWPAASWGRQQ